MAKAMPIDNLIGIFQHVNTIQGDFTQLVEAQGSTVEQSNGNFILQRPDHFRWNVTAPLKQLTVADGRYIWLYQPDLQQVNVSRMTKQIAQTPLAILSGSTATLTKSYIVSESNNGKTFILNAKNPTAQFRRVELTIVKHKITKMILLDNLAQTTTLNFSHVMVNQPLDTKAFQFKPPHGVDVIHD